MKTIKFTVSDDIYDKLREQAEGVGLSGIYAVSHYCRMQALQNVMTLLKGKRIAVLVLMKEDEYERIHKHVEAKKGYAGKCPEATFMLRAAFDIMTKYPAKYPAKE